MTEIIQNQSEFIVSERQMHIIISAADAILSGEKKVAAAEKGQLATLIETLNDYPGVVTEAVWKASFKGPVGERLKASPSKHTLLNRLKRATMGLTLAKEDGSFAPLAEHTNLKKYADWVGPKLQARDAAAGESRKSNARRAKGPKLPEGQTYWLIGAMSDQKYQSVIGDDADLDVLRALAKLHRDEFQSFWFVTAPTPQPLEMLPDEAMRELRRNTAVFTATVGEASF